MTHTVIFSFDRAIQLELLLKSVINHDKEKLLDVTILYASTSPDHDDSYMRLIKRYPKFKWVKEQRFRKKRILPLMNTYWHNYYWWLRYEYSRNISSDFREQLLAIVEDHTSDTVMFLTDDSMFFNDIRIPVDCIQKIENMPTVCSFSLRHGINITGGNYVQSKDLLYWNIFDTHDHPEWVFPFSIDGHIYNKTFIQKTFSKVWFKNPNTLEGNIACYVKEKKLLSTVFGNEESCLVGFELNRVQTISNNNNLNISNLYLNYLFNKGYQMKIAFDAKTNRLFRPEKFKVDACKDNLTINIVTLS